jgi:hypothetical protein
MKQEEGLEAVYPCEHQQEGEMHLSSMALGGLAEVNLEGVPNARQVPTWMADVEDYHR